MTVAKKEGTDEKEFHSNEYAALLVAVDHSSLSKHMKALLSMDSTTITVGKTRLPWAVYYGERSGKTELILARLPFLIHLLN